MLTEYVNVFVNVSGCSGRIGLDETVQPDDVDLQISPNPTNGILNLKLWLSEASAMNIEVQAGGVPHLTGRVVGTNAVSLRN